MQFHTLIIALAWPQTLCDTQTGGNFVKIVSSCSGHPKACKIIQKKKTKISAFPIFFLVQNIQGDSKLIVLISVGGKEYVMQQQANVSDEQGKFTQKDNPTEEYSSIKYLGSVSESVRMWFSAQQHAEFGEKKTETDFQ